MRIPISKLIRRIVCIKYIDMLEKMIGSSGITTNELDKALLEWDDAYMV